jgi:hypothetical protein
MPWLMCTTGSPTFSSDRSLISASTSLTCSCLRRRRACGVLAKSSVSVTNWIDACGRVRCQWKPCGQRRGGDGHLLVARPGTRPAWPRWARRSCGRAAGRAGSRAGLRSRPRSSTRCGVLPRWRSSAPAARWRRGRRPGRAAAAPSPPGSLPRSASVAAAASARTGLRCAGTAPRAAGWGARGRAAGSGGARACRSRSAAARRPLAVQHHVRRRPGSRRSWPVSSKNSGR